MYCLSFNRKEEDGEREKTKRDRDRKRHRLRLCVYSHFYKAFVLFCFTLF